MDEQQVAIILGSQSDEEIVEASGLYALLDEFGVTWTMSVLSAHRHAGELDQFCFDLNRRNIKVIICVVGLKADLPSAVKARLPHVAVIGVPLPDASDGFCDVAGLIHMPPGLPVLVVGSGKMGVTNAGYAALAVLNADPGSKVNQMALSTHFDKKAKKKPRPAEVDKKKSLPSEEED
ncbi:MAG: AIR carboxylase family protein [Patescibacteria group bacterium]